nr:PREDICTED: major histocompatibility complex class I-related gene protein-like [Latimeria chalumnae]|eukprot:XP_006013516.2 PREDICTED: major histocompatibility complex class I-related gene protein-like [Latimeria chalumnae]
MTRHDPNSDKCHMISRGSHYLHFFLTGIKGDQTFPEFLIVAMFDGAQIAYYDSTDEKVISKVEWLKEDTDPDWSEYIRRSRISQQNFKYNMKILMQRANHTGVHVYQFMFGCETNNNGKTRGFDQFGYNGEDYLVFETENARWIAASQFAVFIQDRLNLNRAGRQDSKDFIDHVCTRWLKKFIIYQEKSSISQIPPEVRIIPRKSDDDETLTLSCMITGFYPRDVDVNWVKNGETTLYDTQSSGILPNEDRTFQIQKSIEVHPADTNTYSCQVEHSGLNMTLNVPYDPRTNGNPTVIPGIITGVAIVGILIVTIAGFLVWKYKGKGTRPEGYKPANCK